MRRPCLVLAMALVAPVVVAAQRPPVVWATDSATPCVGLTVSFVADSARAQALVGARWIVAARDGKSNVSLFVTNCARSTIGGRTIGSATIGALILGAAARQSARGTAPARGAVVPVVFGDSGASVPELFRSYAFGVQGAHVSMQVDSSVSPRRVTVTVATPAGRIDVTAVPADLATNRSVTSVLIGTDHEQPSEFAGPEWMERHQATATVRATGTTLLTRLGVTEMPTTALFDTAFGWRFTFRIN